MVAARRPQKPDIRLPFFHLKSGGFLVPLDAAGHSAVDKKLATHAQIDAGFLACLEEVSFRQQARLLIVSTYFRPQEQVALSSLLGIDIPPQNVVREQLPDYNFEEAVRQGREARFRLTVVPAYNYTCALTRYRLVTVNSGSIVDGAHIHQFADSRNNEPTNGIALCKNAHWLFDQGLWSLDDNYRVIVAHDRFDEAGPENNLLRQFEHKQILPPIDPCYLPSLAPHMPVWLPGLSSRCKNSRETKSMRKLVDTFIAAEFSGAKRSRSCLGKVAEFHNRETRQ